MRDRTRHDVADDLVQQYGDVLPETLIRSAVEAAGVVAGADAADVDVERNARTDVAALAAAALRQTAALSP